MICASFPTRNMSHFITVMPNGGSRCSSNQVLWESRKLSRIVRHPNQVLAESVILSRIVRHPNQVLAESVMLSRLVMHSNQIILGPMSTNRLCSNNSDEFVRQHFLCRASIRCSLWKSKNGNISSLPFSLLQRIQKRVSIEMCNNHQTKHGELEMAKTKCITVVMIMVIFVANVGGFSNSALAFNWFGQPNEEKDPVEPFTLYGSIFKKYLIEDLVEGKIVGRRKGFTASACVNALDASKESPELQGMPAGLKVMVIGKPCCAKGEGQTREGACMTPCTHACQAAVLRHVAEVKEETGYILDSSDTTKVTSACSTQCFNESPDLLEEMPVRCSATMYMTLLDGILKPCSVRHLENSARHSIIICSFDMRGDDCVSALHDGTSDSSLTGPP